ncbi:MAG TPA: hypothetical protein VJ812_09765 [Gemmatimonadaceae bacterium]|jgi:hypothetical protein|nr:hypothetical protein [Gemmatimonadaceae bacterium]
MSKRIALFGLAAFAGLAVAGCQRTATVESAGTVSPSVSMPADANSVPSGTSLTLRLNDRLGTENSKVGDRFTATVASDLRAQDGSVVVPSGAVVHGTVTGLKESDNASEQAAIRLDFERININGRDYPFEARIEQADVQRSGESRDETLKKAGIGAAAGAVLGAIIGDGDLGKIVGGAAIGAAAGTVVSLGLGDVSAELPAGTEMRVSTTNTIALR